MPKRFTVYSSLLRLYPKPYRDKYCPQMIQTLEDMLDDPENSRLSVWAETMLDLPISLAKQNLIYAGGIMNNQTPNYVKRSSAVSAALIAPFFVLIIINSVSNHALDFTNSWKSSFVALLIGLPAIALIICAAAFIKWAGQQKSFWKSLIDLRRNWLLLIPGGLALLIVLFVPFHDSAHCVSGNPVKELRNFHDTVRCISRD